MYNVPLYRIRAYVRGLRKSRDIQGRQTPSARFHIRRVAAELRITDGFAYPNEVIDARVVLNDFTPWGLYLFSEQNLATGQQVSLTLNDPQSFFVRGRVTTCKMLPRQGRVITEKSFAFRVGIEFEFQTRQEMEQVRSFIKALLADHVFAEF